MNGIISLIKPPGITSHDAVGIVRRILHEKRVGHMGTLDPLAGGVLPIYVGKATRLVEYGDSFQKTYIAEALFGMCTDTEDISGAVLKCNQATALIPTVQELHAACLSFVGKQEQQPSIYSAIKINGSKAYELAREGIIPEMPKREIEIMSIKLVRYDYPYFVIEVTCSGGTYIRSLLRDIGKKLQQHVVMSHLLRTQVGPYSIDTALTVEELAEEKDQALLPLSHGIAHLPKCELDAAAAKSVSQGKYLRDSLLTPGLYAAYEGHEFFGILSKEDGYLKASKILFIRD